MAAHNHNTKGCCHKQPGGSFHGHTRQGLTGGTIERGRNKQDIQGFIHI